MFGWDGHVKVSFPIPKTLSGCELVGCSLGLKSSNSFEDSRPHRDLQLICPQVAPPLLPVGSCHHLRVLNVAVVVIVEDARVCIQISGGIAARRNLSRIAVHGVADDDCSMHRSTLVGTPRTDFRREESIGPIP